MNKVQVASDTLSNPIYVGSEVAYAVSTRHGAKLRIGKVYEAIIKEDKIVLKIIVKYTKFNWRMGTYVESIRKTCVYNCSNLVVVNP